jgi:hypothetical protein
MIRESQSEAEDQSILGNAISAILATWRGAPES